MQKLVNFANHKWEAFTNKYPYGGDNFIVLVDTDHSEDNWGQVIASVNLDANLPDNMVAIKDYSENAGMLTALTEAGIVSEPVSYIASGFVTVPICKIIADLPKFDNER